MYSNSIEKILIVGAGAFGKALAAVFQSETNEIHFLIRQVDTKTLEQNSESIVFKHVHTFEKFNGDLEQFSLVVFSIPTQSLRSVLLIVKNKYDEYLRINKLSQLNPLNFVSTSKGIEQDSVKLPHEIFLDVWGNQANIAALSGPSFAKEMMRQLPTCLTIASSRKELIQKSISIIHSAYFRLYDSDDIIGVEVGGALKNVIAILSGIVDGLDLGHNAKSAIITLGLSDIVHIGVSMGASPFTFMGLSGLGDLILTCTSDLSRNYLFGRRLAQINDKDKIIKEMGGVVEGLATTKSAYQLMHKLNISSYLFNIIYKILYENLSIDLAIETLLNRKQGSEFLWLKEMYEAKNSLDNK